MEETTPKTTIESEKELALTRRPLHENIWLTSKERSMVLLEDKRIERAKAILEKAYASKERYRMKANKRRKAAPAKEAQKIERLAKLQAKEQARRDYKAFESGREALPFVKKAGQKYTKSGKRILVPGKDRKPRPDKKAKWLTD